MNKLIVFGVIGGVVALLAYLELKNHKKNENSVENHNENNDNPQKKDGITENVVNDTEVIISNTSEAIHERHKEAASVIRESLENIYSDSNNNSINDVSDDKGTHDNEFEDMLRQLDDIDKGE